MPSATLTVSVQPGARQNRVVGYSEGVVHLKVSAPPVEGKANAALVEYLARLLQVKARQITIVKGARSRQKLVSIHGLEQGELNERLAQLKL